MKVGHDAVTVRTVILIAVVAAVNDLTVAYEAVQGILVKRGVYINNICPRCFLPGGVSAPICRFSAADGLDDGIAGE